MGTDRVRQRERDRETAKIFHVILMVKHQHRHSQIRPRGRGEEESDRIRSRTEPPVHLTPNPKGAIHCLSAGRPAEGVWAVLGGGGCPSSSDIGALLRPVLSHPDDQRSTVPRQSVRVSFTRLEQMRWKLGSHTHEFTSCLNPGFS